MMTSKRFDAIVIGASSGGLRALRTLISMLPPTGGSLPVIIVQHIPGFSRINFAEVIGCAGGPLVKEAEEKESIKPDTIYLAPPGYHLLIEKNKTLSLSVDPPVNWARPSIDVLFETAADAFGAHLVGVVLTGANHDGAEGLRCIKAHGGLAVVQDPQDAEVAIMPKAALDRVDVDRILSLRELGQFLAELSQMTERRCEV